jgi:hypothetical protein
LLLFHLFTQEEPEVQWAMNFTAGWIGVYDEKYRTRCIKLGPLTAFETTIYRMNRPKIQRTMLKNRNAPGTPIFDRIHPPPL